MTPLKATPDKPYKAEIKEAKKGLTATQKFVKFLWLWDGVWSVPLTWILFHLYEKWGYYRFGESFVPYDPAFFQAAIYAVCMLTLANVLAFLGLNMNFREIWRYYYCKSAEDFRALHPLWKIGIFLFIYFSFFFGFIVLLKILI